MGSSALLALILNSRFGAVSNGLETEELRKFCIYVQLTTTNTKYTTDIIFRTSFKNLNRNLNLENSNQFMLTTTTHLARLQNGSSNPQK